MFLHWVKNLTLSLLDKQKNTFQYLMVHMFERLSAITSMKDCLFIVLTFGKILFKQVDPVMADNRRELLNMLKDCILRREIVDIAFIVDIGRGRP